MTEGSQKYTLYARKWGADPYAGSTSSFAHKTWPLSDTEESLLTCHLGGSGEGSSLIQRQVLRHHYIPVTPCNTCDSGEYFPSPSLPQRGNLSSHLVLRIERTGSFMAAPISYCIGMTDKHGFLPWPPRWMDGWMGKISRPPQQEMRRI
jgi:hypothetical protein